VHSVEFRNPGDARDVEVLDQEMIAKFSLLESFEINFRNL
jgi:hypothetical protein